MLLLLFISAGWIALSVWLPRTLAPVALLERLFSFSTGVYIVLSHGVSEGKTAKLLLLVLLPWTGAVLVLLWREQNSPPPPLPVTAQTDSLFGKIGAITRSLGGFTAASVSEAEYFPTGREMYGRLLSDLKQAKKTIFLEYYIIARGVFWNEILSVLERKGKDGVTVKVIFDDFGCCLTLPRGYQKQLKMRGIDCRIYRPLRFPSRTAQKRDHRKLAVIDGEIAYTGGINLADEYIGEKIRFGHWKDSAVRVAGEAARELDRLFLSNWDGKQIPPPEPVREPDKIPCAVFADDGSAHVGATVHSALIHGAERRLYLCTPYLAPDGMLLSALKTAAAGGTDVRILIPHIPDKKAVFLLSRSYARELLSAGVRVQEYTAGFLHSKSVVADGKYCIVSSYNFDFRSMYLQAECGLFLESEELAAEMERDFLSVWAESSEVPKASLSERIAGKMMRLFAPLV